MGVLVKGLTTLPTTKGLRTHQAGSVWSSLVFQIPKLLVLSTMQRQIGKSPPWQFCQGLTPEFAHSIRAWLRSRRWAILLWEGRKGRDIWGKIHPYVCLPAFLCYSHLHFLSETLLPGLCGSTVPLHLQQQRILYDSIDFIVGFEDSITYEDCLIQHISQTNWPSTLLGGFPILLNQGAKCFLCLENLSRNIVSEKMFWKHHPKWGLDLF